jgi:hypothetical protein
VSEPTETQEDGEDRGVTQPVADLAAEAERGHTARTPFLALAGVWLAVAVVVAIVLALTMTLYFVYR